MIQQLIHPAVQQYAEDYSTPDDPLMAELAAASVAGHPEHHMLSGHLQGKLLEMISRMISPLRILEIGTFTGYSALALAKGLVAGGKLHTIELREKDAALARWYFDRSSQANQIILHTGNALEVVPALNETWDLVFIDADKVSYKQYFELVLPRLKPNGFILADNIFFHGEVLQPNPKGKNGKAISEFNTFIRDRQDIDKMIITLRDGLYLIRKL
jgi:predicted O-methyltransferase YrrM